MGELKRSIVEHYPAQYLPEDVRKAMDPTRRVTIVVTEEHDDVASMPVEPKYLRYWGAAGERNTSVEEAVARVRSVRDEWIDRETASLRRHPHRHPADRKSRPGNLADHPPAG